VMFVQLIDHSRPTLRVNNKI